MVNTKYLGFLVVDKKTTEKRFHVVDMDNMPPLLQPPAEMLKVVPTMIRKYVEMDRNLVGWELVHFTNWVLAFTRMSPLKRQRSKLDVTIWALPDQESASQLYAEWRANNAQGHMVAQEYNVA